MAKNYLSAIVQKSDLKGLGSGFWEEAVCEEFADGFKKSRVSQQSKQMQKITFDIETKNSFEEVGENNPTLLDISIVCIHNSEIDEYDSFLENDFARLWPILEKADMLIGYNSDHFDIPLLNKHYPGDLTTIKSLDILKEIKNALGHRLKLDNVANATLNEGKSGNGLEAITWWKNGEIEKIKRYCLDDVRITKELYDYALKNKKLKYKDGFDIKDIFLDTANWETAENNSIITPSLPF